MNADRIMASSCHRLHSHSRKGCEFFKLTQCSMILKGFGVTTTDFQRCALFVPKICIDVVDVQRCSRNVLACSLMSVDVHEFSRMHRDAFWFSWIAMYFCRCLMISMHLTDLGGGRGGHIANDYHLEKTRMRAPSSLPPTPSSPPENFAPRK